jgi:hypothetical protein
MLPGCSPEPSGARPWEWGAVNSPPVLGGRFAWIAAHARPPQTPSQFRVTSGGRMAPRGGDCDKADEQVVVMCVWPAGQKSERHRDALRAAQAHRRNKSGLDRRVATDLQLAGSAQYSLPVAGQTGHEAAVTRSGVEEQCPPALSPASLAGTLTTRGSLSGHGERTCR